MFALMAHTLSLDVRALDRARISRDPRFDGKFFIAVKTTGIYCRPICPSRTSRSRNVRYYATAAAAAEAGFRPCLRCRPEAAPGTPAWLGTSAVVRRALRLIDEGILDNSSVDDLANKLGLGSRHLRRLFSQHVGASPISFAQTRRLQFAKRLLDETNLPITEIALAAGFGSLRRFNTAFRQTYGRAPSELRKHLRSDAASEAGDEVILKLAFRPPYDWNQVRDFLAAHAIPGVERVDEHGYSRTLMGDNGPTIICVRPFEGEDALELRVRGAVPAALFQISSTARRAFDASADPARTTFAFQSDPLLGPLVTRRPGLRIPGAWDPFECAVCTILGQNVSIAYARELASRIVDRAGQRLQEPIAGLTRLFPSPTALAKADLNGLGLPKARVAALQELARALIHGKLDFGWPTENVLAALCKLQGIGPATAEYVALRALGEPDAFPATNSILRHMAGIANRSLSTLELEARAEAWRPWRGYAALHLWSATADPIELNAGSKISESSARKRA
ncbi:MAG TPA: AlkA N-terminal domain-containing protein [Pyrinomonadaceae bacterium]|jgi:AraC family transcriptional regulator of adaptative response / DNA-3-methyladenine glycosylase II